MPRKQAKPAGKPRRPAPKVRLKPPAALLVSAAAVPLIQARAVNHAIPEWLVWAVMEVDGRRLKPKYVATGVPVTQELECIVAPPSWACGIAVGYSGPNHPVYLPAKASPVTLVPADRADVSKGLYPAGPHVLLIPE